MFICRRMVQDAGSEGTGAVGVWRRLSPAAGSLWAQTIRARFVIAYAGFGLGTVYHNPPVLQEQVLFLNFRLIASNVGSAITVF